MRESRNAGMRVPPRRRWGRCADWGCWGMSSLSAVWWRALGLVSDARPGRLAALGDALLECHLDALLVTAQVNIHYLTGFSGSSSLVVATPADTRLITDFRYQTQVADEVGALAQVTIEPVSLWTALWRELERLTQVRQGGFEAAPLPHRDFQRLLESGTRWQWHPTSDLVERQRERKDAGEVACIRRAADVAVAAFRRTLPAVRPGMTEMEIAGVLEHALRDGGSAGFAFATIVATGA